MEKLWEWQRTSVRIDSGMRPEPATTSRTRSWIASTTSINHRSKSMNIMKIQVFWYITPRTMVTNQHSATSHITWIFRQAAVRTSNLATEGFLDSDMECQKWEEWKAKTKKKREKRWEQRNNKNKEWLLRKEDERILPLRFIVRQNVVLQRQLQLWEVFTHPSGTKRAFVWIRSALTRQDSAHSPSQKFCTTG